ncbi:hypothetical protein L1987_80387 [Smallanthus sonchifolius]|uniref:Uncharacterized protein n=1 Tax=Smallanthus sonchifolius TaxID=185202 RepID=A0ACB8YNL0_9ASTR|nr:hypothetical protein L1987_80387 [Smallanthus sonchifolius]
MSPMRFYRRLARDPSPETRNFVASRWKICVQSLPPFQSRPGILTATSPSAFAAIPKTADESGSEDHRFQL